MTLDEITTALKSTCAAPTAAPAAGVVFAEGSADDGSGRDWDSRELARPQREPLRSTKIGGNAPCPCGSGKKFKTCCGSGTAPLAH
jgi:uncharacterized protein YecA (UPF0149 family)